MNTIVHTSVHTTFTGPSLHLYTLLRRVAELTEISGQPGIVKIDPGEATQLLVARGPRSPDRLFCRSVKAFARTRERKKKCRGKYDSLSASTVQNSIQARGQVGTPEQLLPHSDCTFYLVHCSGIHMSRSLRTSIIHGNCVYPVSSRAIPGCARVHCYVTIVPLLCSPRPPCTLPLVNCPL